MREVNSLPASEIIDQLRDLHKLAEVGLELYCSGCDFGGYEGEEPSWPCRTAELVYTAEEIAEVLEAIELAGKWSSQRWKCVAPHRQREPRDAWDFVGGRFIADMVFPRVSAERSSITYLLRKDPDGQS